MNLFFDTSAIVKLFHIEQGSQQVEQLILDTSNIIWLSELTRIEFLSTIHRKFREGLLSEATLNESIKGFEEQLQYFSIEPINALIVNACQNLLKVHGRIHSLKTLDAIQLAAFLSLAESDWQFILADEKLNKVANSIGVKTILIQ